METRKTIGERMLERCTSRERSHPALDKKVSRFDDRFARYARTGNRSRISLFLAPDSAGPFADTPMGGVDDANWLSSAPYWARLQRLGNARLRRDQRLAALASRTQHRASLSAIRRLPDARPRSLPFFGLTGLIADQFEVLAPLPQVDAQEHTAQTAVASMDPSQPWQGANRASSPWLSREYTPAKVAQRAEKRPLERIQERAPASRGSVERARSTVERSAAAVPSVKTAAVQHKAASEVAIEPPRRVRRSMRGRVNPTRYIEQDYEAALPDDFLPASRHAQGRIPAQRSGRRRGLRTALSRAPLMAALEPRAQDASAFAVNEPSHAAPRGARISTGLGRSTARRTAHREVMPKAPLLSASPIRRPALMAPSAVTIAAIDTVSDPEVSVSKPAVRRPVVAPTVSALMRANAAPEPLIERPLSQRKPVASRPVLTRTGIYAPEAQVLIPGAAPADVTEDALQQTAEVQAKRSTIAANAMERFNRGSRVDRTPLVDSPISTPVRRNAPVKTESGAYAPAAEVLVPLIEDRAAALTGTTKTGRSAREAVLERVDARADLADVNVRPERENRTLADRLDSESPAVSASQVRRLRPAAAAAEATVLAPLSSPEAPGLAQGQHAAERADSPPTIGQSTTKTVRGFKSPVERMSEAPETRRVAPRYFTSPLSHIRVQRAAAGTRLPQETGAGTDRIILRATSPGSEVPLPRDASRRDAQSAAHERVEQAWRSAGRPLDWTDARIEIIQVPLMVAGTAEEREAPRTARTPSGDYVPARTGTVRASRDVMTDTDSVTLARPEGVRPEGGELDAPRPDVGFAQDVRTSPSRAAIDPTYDEPISRGSRAPRAGAWRSGFDATMGRVGTGAVHTDMPIWAQRSTGRPRIKSGDDLVQQLAHATAPEDVVQVLMDQGSAARSATSSLPQPVIQVIQQIKTEATRAEEDAVREYRAQERTLPTETVRARASRREGLRSTTRVASGMTGLNPRGSSSGQSSQAMNKVTQLAKKLQELIAMAESQNRSGARQQVRMAEDSGAAKAEGQAAPTSAESGRDSSADIDTLAREVTEQVTRELEMRRERRQEDPDGRSIWW